MHTLFKKIRERLKKAPRPRPADWGDIADSELYRPLFSPWLGGGRFGEYYGRAAGRTVVSRDRCYVLYVLIQQALYVEGDIWECGVYRGGTAAMIAAIMKDSDTTKKLYLFDTFEGMPATDGEKDWHKKGDFSDTTDDEVRRFVGCEDFCALRKGFMPDTFNGLESATIAFVHIDVDIYRSVLDCLEFVWPRLSVGGFIVFDDYGHPTCPGARQAVDEFFSEKKSFPLCLASGQAVVFKGSE